MLIYSSTFALYSNFQMAKNNW